MSGRTEKGAATKQRILRTAADLFHKQGVVATSPDEIIEESGTGKSQFYHYFGSKEGLVHQVLLGYIDGIESGTANVDYEIHSWDDLERWFMSHLELQRRFRMLRGCPYGTIGYGITEGDELVRQDLSHLFEVVKGKLRTFFIREKAQGRLKPDADEGRLADFCLTTIQGATLVGKVKRSPQPVEASFKEALAHLRQYIIASAV